MRYSFIAAGLCLPFALSAQDEPVSLELEPVIVTASRISETEASSLSSVSIIDRAEIEARQFRSVPDALRGLPGVAVARSGGPGQPASVYLRGTNSGHVLVLIDGVRVGSATLGTSPWQDLPIEQIERIEVVRGPRSSLYGSEAIGGVIQIFTRRGGGPLRPRLSVGAGSFDTASISGGLSGGEERGWFDVGASFERTDGIDACAGRAFPFAGCGVEDPDLDGNRNLGLNLRAGYAFNEAAEIDVHLLQSENRTDFDGSVFSGNLSRSEQQVLGVKGVLRPSALWTLTLSAGRSQDKYRAFYEDDFIGEIFIDRFDSERDTLSLHNALEWTPAQRVIIGVDRFVDRIDGTTNYREDSRVTTGVFGQYLGTIARHELSASLRHDDDEQFGGHTTGSAAWGYRLDAGTRVSIGFGTAFKAPTFNDLYFPGYGSATLRPEQSSSLELGLSGAFARGDWALSLYQTEIDELIAPVLLGTRFAAANIDSAQILGFEGSGRVQVLDWDLAASLTLLDHENRSAGSNQGNRLPRRPEQMFQLDLDRQFARWSAGASLYVAGRSFEDLPNRQRLDAYSLVDVRAEYAFSPAVRIQARLENALDEDYQTADLYNQPGRAFYVTLRYAP